MHFESLLTNLGKQVAVSSVWAILLDLSVSYTQEDRDSLSGFLLPIFDSLPTIWQVSIGKQVHMLAVSVYAPAEHAPGLGRKKVFRNSNATVPVISQLMIEHETRHE